VAASLHVAFVRCGHSLTVMQQDGAETSPGKYSFKASCSVRGIACPSPATQLIFKALGALYGSILFWVGLWTALDADFFQRSLQRDMTYTSPPLKTLPLLRVEHCSCAGTPPSALLSWSLRIASTPTRALMAGAPPRHRLQMLSHVVPFSFFDAWPVAIDFKTVRRVRITPLSTILQPPSFSTAIVVSSPRVVCSCALAPSLSTALHLHSLMLLQYMQCAVREKRIFAVLCCDLLLLLLLLIGLVGCLLFWLGL
jgi:hypothetical protein